MAIKVNIPSGQNTATVSGLYQWDYGQVLEIESTDLSNMIGEVHFACPSMSEAIVVSCNFTEGLGSVTIPDECLEQSSNITAWIYEIAGTQGRTRKVITIYVTARTRPSVGQDIPTEISNRYTELITEVNEAVDKLKNGDTVVKKATEADRATTATSAGNASTANYAVQAGKASVLTGVTSSPLSDGKCYIDSTGIYVVVFDINPNSVLHQSATEIFAITDLDSDYMVGRTLNDGGYVVYDSKTKRFCVYDKNNSVADDGIIAVYKIADI
jgi:hypothetical protein